MHLSRRDHRPKIYNENSEILSVGILQTWAEDFNEQITCKEKQKEGAKLIEFVSCAT